MEINKATNNLKDLDGNFAISALMSSLKHVVKLIGCCLDFELPVLANVYPGRVRLTDFLGENPDVTLSWGHRIKIARYIASMVVYLHTCFPISIIHRDLKPSKVLIDQNGDAKLFDFSLAVEIPRGESEVEEPVAGTWGFLDPEYYRTGYCFDFDIPCLVFEDVGSTMTLYEVLYSKNHNHLLSWGHRLKISSDIAVVVSHLHTAFSTPMILQSTHVI
ncbi:hypothetical protein Leryth_012289 [Lithospermum erythrorhizon]|nr:hypothetical protein Leryth_012289 [Lithospermum erythrorhizon]